MLTAAAIKDLGLSRSLTSLINGESLLTSVLSTIIYTNILEIHFRNQNEENHNLARNVMNKIWSSFVTSLLFGILNSRLIQLWMSTIFDDDVNYISLIFSILYSIFYFCELVGMSGMFTLATMGLFLNSTSFKPGVETLLLQFWDCLSFVAFLMVFTFIGILIPAQTYFNVSFFDIYYSLNIYFTLLVLRLVMFLMLSPLLSRLGHGFSWRWAFIVAWSEMKGIPNINMAVLFAFSELSLATEAEKSRVLFHALSVCLISLIINNFILPIAVSKLGFQNVTSTKHKSFYHTFERFQELIKSTAVTLKFDKDLANADWNIVEKEITLQNPYCLDEEEKTDHEDHERIKCPNCNKEIDEAVNLEAMALADRRLLSAQMASYQRQYRSEILSQNAVQVLVGASESFGEKKGEYINPETIKKYSQGKKMLDFTRKVLLNWVYNTKKERYAFLHMCHKIVFSSEFDYIGLLVVLMNIFPIIISLMLVMKKEYFTTVWNLFELSITLLGIITVILTETKYIIHEFYSVKTSILVRIIPFLRIVRILKLITPKILKIIDKTMRHQNSFKYDVLKGYIQGEIDIMNIIDKIAVSKQVKEVLLKREIKNMKHALKELGYLEYDHPEIAITIKTKEEINVMLNMAKEIVKGFRVKGIIRKLEGAQIKKLIMDKRKEMLDFKSIIKPASIEETLYHIPWLDKNEEHIQFIQSGSKVVTFDCGNDIFKEGDKPKGIYIIISGMVKLDRSKTDSNADSMFLESEESAYPILNSDYVLSGEMIGELNCLTDKPMPYSATCTTVVETYFIPKSLLYEAFENCSPFIEQNMWRKIGRAVAVRKIREHLSFEDWDYKLQLKLSNMYVKDIPRSSKVDIYEETVIYVLLIHGSVEDCQLRKIYKAPFLIPVTCHQIQATEDFTKVVIIRTAIDTKKFRGNMSKYGSIYVTPTHRSSETVDEMPVNSEASSGAAGAYDVLWLKHTSPHTEEAAPSQTLGQMFVEP
ncbi:solute carrier family 9 member C1 [Ctenodactylus gundi]